MSHKKTAQPSKPAKPNPPKMPPATTKPRKPQKITYPRLCNAIEELIDTTDLTTQSTIAELFDALQTAYFKDAKAK